MNIPTNPVHTLPLSSTTTATSSVSTAPAMTSARAPTDWSSRQMLTSKNDNGLNPRINRPATATAANTASTDVRPSSAQYTSCKCRISANSSSTRAAPIPKKVAATVNSGTPPSTAKVTMETPETMTKITPITTWWMCRPPPAEMLRGCHHLRGASLPAWLRMYRTIVRVTKNVRMNATRQNTSGSRPCGIENSRSNVARTQKTYADVRVSWPGYHPTRRWAPIRWSAT